MLYIYIYIRVCVCGFIHLRLAGSPLLCPLWASRGEWGCSSLQCPGSHRSGRSWREARTSGVRAQRPGSRLYSACSAGGTAALVASGTWALGPGVKPTSPVLAGRFCTLRIFLKGTYLVFIISCHTECFVVALVDVH